MLANLYRSAKRRWFSGDNTASSRPKASREQWIWRLKLAVCLAIPVFLETLDYTVVATAQTHIASVFNRLDIQTYIGTVYLLTSTVFLPWFASVADVYGRHFALQLSFALFVAGSALSTGSRNMEMMLAGRAIAGIGAAGLLTVVRVIMADSASLDDNNWQVSIMFILYTIGYSTGPVIGGTIVKTSFRWIFGLNLPTTALASVLCFFLIRKGIKGPQPPQRLPFQSSPTQPTFLSNILRIDWIGTMLFVAGGILLLLGLNWGSTGIWTQARVIVCLILGPVILAACLLWQHQLGKAGTSSTPPKYQVLWADPTIPLEVFKNYDVCATMFGSFVGGMIMIVIFYFVAIFMTVVTGLSAVKAGVQLIFFAPGMGAGVMIGVYLTDRTRQPKNAIWLGSLIAPISLGLMSMGMDQEKQSLVNGFMVMAGVSVGLTSGSLTIHARFSQPEHRVAVVSSLALFFRSFGGTVGLAQCATVMNSRVKSYLASNLPEAFATAFGSIGSGAGAHSVGSIDQINRLPPDVQDIVRSAFRDGTRWAFLSMVPWAVIAFVLVRWLSDIQVPVSEGVAEVKREVSETATENSRDGRSESFPMQQHNVEAVGNLPNVTDKEVREKVETLS